MKELGHLLRADSNLHMCAQRLTQWTGDTDTEEEQLQGQPLWW